MFFENPQTGEFSDSLGEKPETFAAFLERNARSGRKKIVHYNRPFQMCVENDGWTTDNISFETVVQICILLFNPFTANVDFCFLFWLKPDKFTCQFGNTGSESVEHYISTLPCQTFHCQCPFLLFCQTILIVNVEKIGIISVQNVPVL